MSDYQAAFEQAKNRIISSRAANGLSANNANFFAETNQRPASSNDPSFLNDNFAKAKNRVKNSTGGIGTGSNSFNETNQKVSSSNDPSHMQESFQKYRNGLG